MANIYVRSTDGSDSEDGSTWALAKATITGADGIDAAGDQINVSQAHAENSSAAHISWTFAGTRPSPTRVLCVNDGAEPPTTLATGGSVQTTNNYDINIRGNVYVYGMTFIVGVGSGSNPILYFENVTGNFDSAFESCAFRIAASGSVAVMMIGSTGNIPGNRISWKNCTARFGASGQGLEIYHDFRWNGGGLESGGTNPTSLFKQVGFLSTGRCAQILAENLDLSNASTTMNLVGSIAVGSTVVFRNIKLPASWAGNLVNGTQEAGAVAKLHNYTIGTTEYMMWEQYWSGSIKSDTAHYRSGGASDGTTAHCWLMATTANAAFPHVTLESPEIVRWNATTGSAINVTVEIAQEGGSNLDNDEIWLEVNYLGNSGVWQGALDDDDKCGILATPAAQTTSSETWTGFTTPTRQKLEATFTPQEAGFIIARVRLAKPSASVYVCPKLVIS